MECHQAETDSAIFWTLSDVNISQSPKCWENFSLQNFKNDSQILLGDGGGRTQS